MNKIHSAIGDHLRSRTRLAHAAVDRHSVLRPLMSPGVDLTAGGTIAENTIITNLLTQGKLITD